VNADDVIAAVAADADDGGVVLSAGEAERQTVAVSVGPLRRREAVVQHARLVAERVRHAVCTAAPTYSSQGADTLQLFHRTRP